MPDGLPISPESSLRHILLDRQLWTSANWATRSWSKGYDLEDFFHRNKELRVCSFPLSRLLVSTDVERAAFYEAGKLDLITRATNVLAWRRLVCTAKGKIGLAPANAQQNDRVVMLQGCNVPLVLRKQEDMWKLIGECYIHGIMRDEADAFDDEWTKRIESISIT